MQIAPYLSPEALDEIILSRERIKNAFKTMANKYRTSTRRIYEIWRRHAQGLSQRKQQISDPFTTNSTNRVNEHGINSNNKPYYISLEDLVSEIVGAKFVDDLYTRLKKDRMDIEKAIHETEELMR